MANRISLKIKGGYIEFTDNTDQFKELMYDAINRALVKIGITASSYAKLLCPVDTGRLRNSITYSISGANTFTETYHDQSGTAFTQDVGAAGSGGTKYVIIGTNVEYAPGIEFGTHRKKGPAKFLSRAAGDHMNEYLRILEQEAGK